jgi:transposase
VLTSRGSQRQAASLLHVDAKTLRRWTQRFLSQGREGLADRPRQGRPRKLDAQAEVFLEGVLRELPTDYGYATATWTLTDLQDLLTRHGWVSPWAPWIARCPGWAISIAVLGLIWITGRMPMWWPPPSRPSPSSKKGADHTSGIRLLYRDECHLHPHPHLAKVWQPRGAPTSIPAAGVDQRVTLFGALEYRCGAVTTMVAKHASSPTFQTFVETLVTRWPNDHLVLVLDNASYHKSAALRQWLLHQAPHVSIIWLPTYAPQLNLIERVWRFLKSKLACHRYWNDLPSLIALAERVLANIRATFAAPAFPHISMVQNL